jgi:hypothetical protein
MSISLRIDPAVFHRGFRHHGFVVEHALVGHPLLALDALVELGRRWPRELVECNAGHVPVAPDPTRSIARTEPLHEVLHAIGERPSWVVLKNLERDPAYRDLVDRCLDEVRIFSEASCPGMNKREAFVFVSSPGSVTPFHMDPEHNFLLQIRGDKTIAQYDPVVLHEEQLERFYGGGDRSLPYREAFDAHARRHRIGPGQGLYFPVTTPHWVRVGDEPSISLSITFRTEESNRREHVYRVNRLLRRAGIVPLGYGRSHARDVCKVAAFSAARAVYRVVRGLGRSIEHA